MKQSVTYQSGDSRQHPGVGVDYMLATVKRLPSGHWAVWVGDTWIDAASLTAAQAADTAHAYGCTHVAFA